MNVRQRYFLSLSTSHLLILLFKDEADSILQTVLTSHSMGCATYPTVCDGLKRLPSKENNLFPRAAEIFHLVRELHQLEESSTEKQNGRREEKEGKGTEIVARERATVDRYSELGTELC